MVKKKNKKNFIVVSALILIVFGGVVLAGVLSGWFGDKKVKLDAEYYTMGEDFMNLGVDEYEDLIEARKSFVIFVDQTGCTTADRLREYTLNYMKEMGISAYRIMFEDMKETALHEFVKYYPSVVVVGNGEVMGWLKADSDEDAEVYNNYDDFRKWMENYLK